MGYNVRMPQKLVFKHILSPNGIRHNQAVLIEKGRITAITPADDRADGPGDGYLALPGMPNAHSHAFQRALSGLGEARRGKDSFWSWRAAMYRLANAITPEDCYAIARLAFADMLRGGFTGVAEFHYLHHLPDGTPGPQMGQAVIEAARSVGLPITLLPVFYQCGGFGQAALPEQRRFVHADSAAYLRLLEQLAATGVPLGIAPHSLRAAPAEVLPELVQSAATLLGAQHPIHIHIAEQTAEVEACLAAHGKRPVELLGDSVALNARWNLVHATHITPEESAVIAGSGARVVICPVTEAYLGDGLCPADAFVAQGGRLAIGSDSNCRIDALEELRWLEYGQRLRVQARARFANADGVGAPLWQHAVTAGAAALGHDAGGITVGAPADFVVFEENAVPFLGHSERSLVDALLINGSARDIAAVYVGGRRVIEHGVHAEDAAIRADYARVMNKLQLEV